MKKKSVPGASKKRSLRQYQGLVLMALVALAMNLRSPLTAIPPVVAAMQQDLGLSSSVFGLLTSMPVLCFGLLTPLASALIVRTGIQNSIYLTLLGAAIGLLLRPYSGVTGLLGGTLLIGAALAVGNIVSLMVIARDFRHSLSGVTGLYTSALNIGTMLTSSLTAPLATIAGWRFALASWLWLPLLSIILWWYTEHRRSRLSALESESEHLQSAVASPDSRSRNTVVWLLSLAFFLHLFIYYSLTAWMPTYLIHAETMSATQAGMVASVFQVFALAGAFGIPALTRYFPVNWHLITMGVCWLIAVIWMIVAPGQWLAWTFIGGIAQGGCFVVIFMLIMHNSSDLDDNRRISTIVQGLGIVWPLRVLSLSATCMTSPDTGASPSECWYCSPPSLPFPG